MPFARRPEGWWPAALACVVLAAVAEVFTPTRVPTALAGEARASTPGNAGIMSVPAKRLFGAAKTPAHLKPQPIGFYSRGCAAGNVKLELTGDAWQVMRPSRNRFWGQPQLIRFLKTFARKAKHEIGWNGLLVGDLSQPRGGPMTSGHASHQIGLDADIWLTEMPDRVLSMKERETISAVLMTLDRKRINPKRFTVRHAKLIRMAAKFPQVQRIFVHPPIKKYLCGWAAQHGDLGAWLAKIRPYYGHNYHFHVRLRCPKGARYCRDQGDPREPDGTGCGRNLAYWYSSKPWGGGKKKKVRRFYHGIPIPRPRPRKPKPRRQITLADLPKACRLVLSAR